MSCQNWEGWQGPLCHQRCREGQGPGSTTPVINCTCMLQTYTLWTLHWTYIQTINHAACGTYSTEALILYSIITLPFTNTVSIYSTLDRVCSLHWKLSLVLKAPHVDVAISVIPNTSSTPGRYSSIVSATGTSWDRGHKWMSLQLIIN